MENNFDSSTWLDSKIVSNFDFFFMICSYSKTSVVDVFFYKL